MKLRVFQSDKGDCLLLSSSDNNHMLIDGGMSGSFNDHTAQYLSQYIDKLDRVCVTHIDQDHIQGLLEMCNHMVDWRVYDYQKSIGNSHFKVPKSPRPPKVAAFWHNAFEAQFGDNAGQIANSASMLSSIFSSNHKIISQNIAEALMDIATSQREGYLLSQKLGTGLLDIPVNPESNGDLLLFSPGNNVFSLGNVTLRLIAPFKADIDKLRSEWEKWINTSKGVNSVRKIKDSIEKESDRLETASSEALKNALSDAFYEMDLELQQLGKRQNVTTPNLASIMFVAEKGNKKILFTGDGHWEDIDKGLTEDGTYDPASGIHFDAIKVPHHGSEHNTNLDFWRRMTADHYVFCSDGSHHNPDLEILEKIVQSRREDSAKGLPHSGKPYKFWFNSSSFVTKPKNSDYMKQVYFLVKKLAGQGKKRLSYEFPIRNSKHSFVVK